MGGAKSKPKKKSKPATSAVTQQWSELFTLPDRHCESAETAAMEEAAKKSRGKEKKQGKGGGAVGRTTGGTGGGGRRHEGEKGLVVIVLD